MPNTRTFRLFLSSTFSDFRHEREALQQRVFPQLQRFCEERGATYQAVDLRWGITEEAQQERDTMRICLEEVRRCQELSPKPNFAVLLGDRYGWEPVPARIPMDHWQRLIAVATSADRKTLRAAYEGPDRNAVPPVYQLRPRQGSWAENKAKEIMLHDVLHRTADAAGFEGSERLPYFASATHQEIVIGALDSAYATCATEHVHVYIRRIEALPRSAAAQKFIDWDSTIQAPITRAYDLVRTLEAELRQHLPGQVHEFSTRWTGNDIDTAHLDAFCARFLEDQQAIIEAELARMEDVNESRLRNRQHQEFASERVRNFRGRTRVIRRIERYISRSGQTMPLVVHGDGGSGKTALLAHTFERATSVAISKAVTLIRFIGGVPGSESLYTLLNELVDDLAQAYEIPKLAPPETMKAASEAFAQALAWPTADRPLLLFLDALDQLEQADNAWLLEWLPKELGEHVRIITSTRSGQVFLSAQLRYPTSLLLIPPMQAGEARQVLAAWLADTREAHYNAGIAPTRQRKLTPRQRAEVLTSFAHMANPLWLKLAYEEVRAWPSWKEPQALPTTIEGMVQDLIRRRLLKGAKHPPIFTTRALAYLAGSRFGLSDCELSRALATDPIVRAEFESLTARTGQHWDSMEQLPPILWSRLFFDVQPYLTQARMDGALVYRWFHREFKDEIEQACLATDNQKKDIHGHLAHTFYALAPEGDDLFTKTDASGSQQTAALRRVMEEPWQLAKAGDRAALMALLTNFGFCMGKCAANRSNDLASDWFRLGQYQPILSSTGAMLESTQAMNSLILSKLHLLSRGTTSWPAHRILLQLASEQPLRSPVTTLCNEWLVNALDDWHWLRSIERPTNTSTHMITLEGHSGGFTSFVATELLSGKLLSRHNDYRVWNMDTGMCEATYPFNDAPLVVACSRHRWSDAPRVSHLAGGREIIWAIGPHSLRFWEKGWEGMSICQAVELMDGRIALREDEKSIIVVDSAKITAVPLLLAQHTAAVLGFTELKDDMILSWSEDSTMRIWNITTGECVQTIIAHHHPVIGVLVIPGQRFVSWDDYGGFFLTYYLDGCTHPLDSLEPYDDSDMHIDDSEARAYHGAMWLEEESGPRLVAWNTKKLNWYDEAGNLLQTCDNGDLSGIAFLPGIGVARVYVGEKIILITDFNGQEVARAYENDVKFINGILCLSRDRLMTWSGYKGGDDTLRVWEAVRGDWRQGMQLAARLETRSRWIYNVYSISADRIVSCSEDDSLRVWRVADFYAQAESDSEMNGSDSSHIEATELVKVGNGLWAAYEWNYGNKEHPLVLVDALRAEVKIIRDIVVPRMELLKIQNLTPEMIVVNGYCVVDLKTSSVCGIFEDAREIEETGDDRRRARQLTPITKRVWLAFIPDEAETTPNGDKGNKPVRGGDLSLWGWSDFGDIFKYGSLRIVMSNMRRPISVDEKHFAVWGTEQRIQFWKIVVEEWPEQNDIFTYVGEVTTLPESPAWVLALPSQRLAALSEAGHVTVLSARSARILAEYDLGHPLVTVEATPSGLLVCGSPDGTIRFLDLDQVGLNATSGDLQAAAPLKSVVSLNEKIILTFSEEGIVQRWDRESGKSITLYAGYGLSAGSAYHHPDGSVLVCVGIAPRARGGHPAWLGNAGLIWYDAASNRIYLLESNHERLALHDESDKAVIYWHFTRGADRDRNEPGAINSSGAIVTIAEGILQRLQVIHRAKACPINL